MPGSDSPIIRWLYALQGRGMKFGLKNTRTLLRTLGNPHESFPAIHIAGTNGKGSTASFIASVFQEAGYRTALYTSPHLVRFTERIKVDGKEIPLQRLESYVRQLRPAIEKTGATFFEATTSIAFRYFADQGVEIAVVETGLGGRLDSTNVLDPLAAVITTIGFDHMELLGPTLTRIAAEKGGIIKRGGPVIIGQMKPPADEVLTRIARTRGATLTRAAERVELDCGAGGKVSYAGHHFSTGLVKVGLEGAYQTFNAGLAVAVFDTLFDQQAFRRRYPRITASRIARGIERVREHTAIAGRMMQFGRGRRILLDVAHNQDGMHAAIQSLVGEGTTGLTVVFGVMKDKAYLPMLKQLEWVAEEIITVQPRNPRAATSARLCKAARHLGLPATDGGSVSNGLKLAQKRNRRILVIGSHYVVGEVMSIAAKKTT